MNNNKNQERICMITGANSGIGKETARQLADKGFTIIMVCRNKARGEQARNEIIEQTGNKNIDLLIADFGSLKSIQEMVNKFKEKYLKLHILINNAGTFAWKRTLDIDGFESTFAINYLAPFFLTNLLLGTMIQSAPARIVNLSSDMHLYQELNFNDLMLEKKYSSQKAYGASKIAIVLFTYELVHRLSRIENIKLKVNCCHPGHVKTQMFSGSTSKFFNFVMKFFSSSFMSVEKGAKTSVFLASSPEVEEITGKYWKNSKPKKSKKMTYDRNNQRKLWDLSQNLIKKIIPEFES